MRRKNNNYIKYEKLNKKQKSIENNLLGKILGIILFAFGIGGAAFYLINHPLNMKTKENNRKSNIVEQKENVKQNKQEIQQNNQDTQVKQDNEEYQANQGKTIIQDTQVIQNDQKKRINQADTEGSMKNETGTKDSNRQNSIKNKKQVISHATPVKVKGIYVTARAAGSFKLKDLITIADKKEINTFVIDIKDDFGRVTYSMDNTMAKKIGATTDYISDINKLMKVLKSKNIYTIARIVAFKDPYLAEHRHDLAIKNNNGTLFRDSKGECWVNPYKKEVWAYLLEIADNAANVGFDEIQFDYIRFCTDKGINKVDFGEVAKEKTKEDIILDFTKYAYNRLKPLGVYVSADVFGAVINSKVDAKLVGQNYVEMSKYLDYICPMIYPSHFGEGNYGVAYPDLQPYTIITKVLETSKLKLKKNQKESHCAIVRPWLQDFTATWVKHHKEYGSAEINEQINGVYDAGYEEWLLWNSTGDYSVNGLQSD